MAGIAEKNDFALGAICFCLWTAYSYVLLSFLNYRLNREAYHRSPHLPAAIPTVAYNVLFFVPVSALLLLLAVPPAVLHHGPMREALHAAVQYVAADVWFYSCHRLVHSPRFYWLHKQHHELRDPVGMLALYAHPVEAVVVNAGSVFVVHALLRTSWLHLAAVFTAGLANTIMISHSGGPAHDAHHKLHTVNFGFGLFMDRLFGTHYDSTGAHVEPASCAAKNSNKDQ